MQKRYFSDDVTDLSDAVRSHLRRRHAPDQARSLVLLTGAWLLAYVLSPYWLATLHAVPQQPFLFTLMAGLVWVWAGGGRLPQAHVPWGALTGLLCLSLGLNALAVQHDVPYRGDEPDHIGATRLAVHLLKANAVPFLLGVAMLWTCASRRLSVAWKGGILLAGTAALHAHMTPATFEYPLFRYPMLSRWIGAITVLLPGPLAGWHAIWAYRLPCLLAFVSLAAMAHVHCRRRLAMPALDAFLVAAAFLLAPVTVNFSSIAYIEPLMTPLLFLVMLHPEALFPPTWRLARKGWAWHALLLAGFLKETAAPFLAGCGLCLAWTELRRGGVSWTTRCGRVATLGVALLVPLATYLVYRKQFGIFREFGGEWGNALSLALHGRMLWGLWEQLGLLLPLSLAGLALAWRRPASRPLFLAALAQILCFVLFFYTDSADYVGYARFTLLLLPTLLVLSLESLTRLPSLVRQGTLCAVLAGHVLLTPLLPDGSKVSDWGDYGFPVAERHYPYREATQWLMHNPAPRRLYVVNQDFTYPFWFYLEARDATMDIVYVPDTAAWVMAPPADLVKNAAALAVSRGEEEAWVLLRVDEQGIPDMPAPAFRLVRVFSNAAKQLALYHCRPAAPR